MEKLDQVVEKNNQLEEKINKLESAESHISIVIPETWLEA